jgi:hypothetical protein
MFFVNLFNGLLNYHKDLKNATKKCIRKIDIKKEKTQKIPSPGGRGLRGGG